MYGTKAKGKATKLHSLIVRSRGICESCGETDYAKLQCAHIVSRRYSSTRTLEKNAFALCQRCHMHFTAWPIEFAHFVESKIGKESYAVLKQMAQKVTKMDWDEEAARLQVEWDIIQEAT